MKDRLELDRHKLAFHLLLTGLSERLNDPLDPASGGANEVKDQLREFLALLHEGRLQEAAWQAARLESLIRDYDAVAEAMPGFAREARKRLVVDDQTGGYAGVRSELAMAAFLLRQGVPLRRGAPEMADFFVPRPEGTVLVECTSAHVLGDRKDTCYKIESAVRGKAGRPYCGPAALLHVDITAVLRDGGDTFDPEMNARLKALLDTTPWGALVLSFFAVRMSGNEYHRYFIAVPGACQDAALVQFLAETMPKGPAYKGPIAVPPLS